MTISLKIRSQLFCKRGSAPTEALIESTDAPAMTATATTTTTGAMPSGADTEAVLIRLPLTRPLPGPRKRKSRAKKHLANKNGLGWSDEEHERFLRGLEIFPAGPWKTVAAYIGTRTTRQVMTHAQKYRQKIARRQRGLQVPAHKPVTQARAPDAPVQTIRESIDTGTHKKASFAAALRSPYSSSPSSADQALSECDLLQLSSTRASDRHSENQTVNTYHSFSDLVMTEDEFKLATDELYAEKPWSVADNDERLEALAQDIDDPLVLMFQDPSSFSFAQSKSSDWIVPPLWISTSRTLS